ncbi:hypothetical protein SAMN04488129_10953 [Halomonas daqiaonensis]|uniref:Uncharacterized protein n=1 Tax=Halomonas daqiaonensis TaxID=650850 RepID=A0A1H7PI48_9GAMM|nr:hypothetical protein SAMN04488129_10953 [Halomonas daqiaonensis]
MTASIAIRLTRGFAGHYGYWRFSELRSDHCATSGRSEIGGNRHTRCMIAIRS